MDFRSKMYHMLTLLVLVIELDRCMRGFGKQHRNKIGVRVLSHRFCPLRGEERVFPCNLTDALANHLLID